MTATYALDLTAMSADLFCRRDGGWVLVGTIPLPEADLGARIVELLDPAGAARGARVAVSVPPEEVVLVTAPAGAGDAARRARAAALIDGRDDPDTLRLDWRETPEGLGVATMPLATLGEAETFLRGLGLEPLGCGARFGTEPFADGAWFGRSDDLLDAEGRAVRPGFLPLPWTAQTDATPAAWDAAAPQAPAVDPARAVHLAPLAHAAASAPPPSLLGAGDRGYQAARARALAIARRTPLAFASLVEAPESATALVARRSDLPGEKAAPRSDWPKRSDAFLRQSRRGAVLSLCLAAGLAAAALLPEIGLTRASLEDPSPDWTADAEAESDAAVWLDTGSAEEEAEVIVDAGPEDAEIVLASFAPAAAFAPPAAPAGMAALSYPGLDRVFRTDALTLTDRARKPAPTGPQVGLTKPSVPHETFAYDDRGLIRPTRAGTLSPEGYKVYAGKPSAKLRPRPERSAAVPPVILLTDDASASAATDNPLRKGDPKPRPAGLGERFERARLGGRTEQELAAAAPAHRPASAQETARAAAPAAAAPSSYAVAKAPRPAVRTDGARSAFDVASAAPLVIPAALAPLANAPVTAPPKAPTRMAVAAVAPGRPVAVPKPQVAARPTPTAQKPAAAKPALAARPSPEPASKTRTATAKSTPAQPKAVVAEAPAKPRTQAAQTKPAQTKQAPAPATTTKAEPAQTRTAAASPNSTTAKNTAAKSTATKNAATKKSSEVTLVASAASGASPKQVQDRATSDNMLDLSELNLLGTFGSNADARAIVRMPNGKVVNVAVGDRLDGGQVASIGDGQLNYIKRGKTHVLQMPRG